MTTGNYETFVLNNAKQGIKEIEYSFVGLAGETGECMEWLKKAYYRQNPKFTHTMLLSELGDVLHYLTRIALFFGWTLEDVMDYNKKKLEERNAKNRD